MNETRFTFDDNIVSDLHKDAYGYRPSRAFWARWNAMSDLDKQLKWEAMCAELDAAMAMEKKVQEKNLDRWASRIHQMSMEHNISLADAVRWDMQALDCTGDAGFYCYHLGISYSHEKKIEELIR